MTMSMTEHHTNLYVTIVSPAAVIAGKRLGLYQAIEEEGCISLAELASQTWLPQWVVRRWLAHQVASGNVTQDDLTDDYMLSPVQAAHYGS